MRQYRGESRDEWEHVTCPDDLIEKPRFEVEYDPDTDPDWGKDAEQPKEGTA